MSKHVICLIDQSGSMHGHEKETREAIINIIKGLEAKTHLKLVFFDSDEYQRVADDLVVNIIPEIGYIYKARGGTPITDTLLKCVQETTEDLTLEHLNEDHCVVVFTDGQDNSNQHSTPEEVGAAISHLTENFGWEFKFLGPKSEEVGITSYANSIKIKPENLTLYSDVKSGLKEMQAQVLEKS